MPSGPSGCQPTSSSSSTTATPQSASPAPISAGLPSSLSLLDCAEILGLLDETN
jgi:hypothetical protein